MTRDEVISGLEKCAASECNEKCPYNGINYGCRPRLMLDAVELLKEQEPQQAVITTNSYGTKFYHCPRCNRDLYTYPRQYYCSNCGQALKWE